jgi:hypothetical protein
VRARLSCAKAALALFALAAFALAPRTAFAGDPYVHWYTVRSPHFRVHYHAGLERVAQKAANIGEDVYARLVPELGFTPDDVTELVLTDEANDSNGFANTLPYSRVTLFVTAPSDMSGLGDYDDWLTGLFTHEFTHILHTGNVSGAPDVVNSIFGPTLHPNQLQPHWIIEGLAVAMETEHTSGGRLRSSQFEMLMRADVLEGNLARLDQVSNVPYRWPGANLWYLYGAHFIAWIEDIYGPNVYAAVAADYGATLIPFGINRAIRRATGLTYEELYKGFRADLERKVIAEVAAVERFGRREGRRITFAGHGALGPRFRPATCGESPSGAASEHPKGWDFAASRSVVYHRDGPDDPIGVYEVPLDGESPGDRADIIAQAVGRTAAFMPDCSLVFDHVQPSLRGYVFSEIMRQPAGTRSPRGVEKNRERLTFGRRAREPDVSADGRRIVYVTDREGTSTLRIADLGPTGTIEHERRLVPSAYYEQVFTPRFSPDGEKVAYGVWTNGGYRDLRIVDLRTNGVVELWHDRALDQQPAWSPDGKTLFFASDRSGFPNIFAYDIASGALHQVTNVLTGAYMPDVSPDGRTLVYVGYTSEGYDLFEIEIDRSRFLPAGKRAPERPLPRGRPIFRKYPVEPYNALPSLRPRAWSISYGQGTFGNAVVVSTSGADAIGRHAIAASIAVETEHVAPLGSFDYYYSRLPFGFRTSAFRGAAPRDDYRIGEQAITVVEHQTGVTTGVAFGVLGDGEAQNVSLSYTLAMIEHDEPLGDELDPYAPLPNEPDSGLIGDVRLGYDFSNATSTPYAISLERGFRLGVGADFADPAWGSEYTLTAVSGEFAAYVPMPWFRHHVLALGLSGGIAMGTYVARSGFYYTGGFVDTAPFDSFTSGIRQGGFVLRGYEPSQFSGTTYNLLNLEYRFPISYVDRGLSTLPVFMRSLTGVFFMDYGGAYFEMNLKDPLDVYHLGIGAELWMNLVIGYGGFTDLRFGVARGMDDEAPDGWQTYFVLASGF